MAHSNNHTDFNIKLPSQNVTIRLRFHNGLSMEDLQPILDRLRGVKSYDDLRAFAREYASEKKTTFSLTTFDHIIPESDYRPALLYPRRAA